MAVKDPKWVIGGSVAILVGFVLIGVWASAVGHFLQGAVPVALVVGGGGYLLKGLGLSWSELWRQVVQGLESPVAGEGAGKMCPQCQHWNPVGSQFCERCGGSL